MAQVLVQLLKYGSADLLAELFRRHGLDAGNIPLQRKARARFNADIFSRLAFREEGPFPELTKVAERVEALAEGRFDWIFARLGANADSQIWQELDTWNRALWFLLYEPELLERIERKASYEQYSTTRNKHTRFLTRPGAEFNRDRDIITAFGNQVQLTYKKHDGSGLFVETNFEPSEDRKGAPLQLISVGVSQLPSSVEHITGGGERRTDVIRKITDVHVTYNDGSGELFVVASRGGFPVRERVAEHFARYILGIEEAPVVLSADRFQLTPLLKPDDLPPLEGVALKGIDLIELHLKHPDFGSTAMTFRDTTGLPSDLNTRLFGDASKFVTITSATIRLHFDEVGDGRPEPKPLVVTFNADGSTTLRGDLSHELQIREVAPRSWGLAT